MEYSRFVLAEHEAFVDWLRRVPSLRVRLGIVRRLDRLRLGQVGEVQAVGKGVFALKFHCGRAFNLFVHRRGAHVTVLHACAAGARFAEHARHAIELSGAIDTRTLHEPRSPL